ncbi:MAG: hypothetical protein K0Q81_740 [Paenibacillus sp.]|nr:hypothetical protein [Paenibacillus sp.]
MATHSITLYQDTIRQQCLRLFGSLDRLEEYISVIFAHELGHAEDLQLDQLCCKLDEDLTTSERTLTMLQIEENAWQYAERLLSAEPEQGILHTIRMESLAIYREAPSMEELQADIA